MTQPQLNVEVPRGRPAPGYKKPSGSVKVQLHIPNTMALTFESRETRGGIFMPGQQPDPELSEQMRGMIDDSQSNSEAFSIIGMELIELKAMLMTLIDLQKSSLIATGVSESELETNVQNLIDGYRNRFLSALSGRIKDAASQ
jgi:hypothetical protein